MSERSIRRIQTVRDGRLRPLIPRPPLLSSAATADWQGITLEKHLAEAEYVATDFEVYSDLVHIFTGVPVRHEWCVEGRMHREQSMPGSILIEPQGLHASVYVRRSQRAVQNPQMSLSAVSLQAGFADQSHLTHVFRRLVGVTPSQFRALL